MIFFRVMIMLLILGGLPACTTINMSGPALQDLNNVPRARVDADRPNLGLDFKWDSDNFVHALENSSFFSSVRSGEGIKEELVLKVKYRKKNKKMLGFLHAMAGFLTATIIPHSQPFEETWAVDVLNIKREKLASYTYKFDGATYLSLFPFANLLGTSDFEKVYQYRYARLTSNIIKDMQKDSVFSRLGVTSGVN